MNKSIRQKGYAILFTVVVIGIISVIAIGLSNTTYKQLILSSTAKDSQVSYYQSDTATECALYADTGGALGPIEASGTGQISCGLDKNGNLSKLDVTYTLNGTTKSYVAKPDTYPSGDSCYMFTINKVSQDTPGPANPGSNITTIITTLDASGYNICDTANPRTVERTIEVRY